MKTVSRLFYAGSMLSALILNVSAADKPQNADIVLPPPVEVAQPQQPVIAPQAAKAVITDSNGNPPVEFAELGEPLFFSASQSIAGDSPKSCKWIITPITRSQRSRQMDSGRTVVVGTGMQPITITVTLIVAKGDTVDYATCTVMCGSASPQPTPIPGPNPQPIPSANRKAAIAQLTEKYSFSPSEKTAVAASMRTVAKSIDDNILTSLNDILTATSDAWVKSIGINAIQKWLPWRNDLTKLLSSLHLSVKDHAAVWKEVADVLEGK